MLVDLRARIAARDKARHDYNGDLGYLDLLKDAGRPTSRMQEAIGRVERGCRRLRLAEIELRNYYQSLRAPRE